MSCILRLCKNILFIIGFFTGCAVVLLIMDTIGLAGTLLFYGLDGNSVCGLSPFIIKQGKPNGLFFTCFGPVIPFVVLSGFVCAGLFFYGEFYGFASCNPFTYCITVYRAREQRLLQEEAEMQRVTLVINTYSPGHIMLDV